MTSVHNKAVLSLLQFLQVTDSISYKLMPSLFGEGFLIFYKDGREINRFTVEKYVSDWLDKTLKENGYEEWLDENS